VFFLLCCLSIIDQQESTLENIKQLPGLLQERKHIVLFFRPFSEDLLEEELLGSYDIFPFLNGQF